MDRVTVQWTTTARDGLRKLPPKVRRGLLDKANELRDASDPSKVHKPLTGPLQGYYRISYSRFRAIYRVDTELLPTRDAQHRVVILFVAAGIRKEGDKNDIYQFAQRLIRLGVLNVRPEDPEEKTPDDL